MMICKCGTRNYYPERAFGEVMIRVGGRIVGQPKVMEAQP